MRPIIGVCGSRASDDGVDYDCVRCRYVEAVRAAVEGIPLVVPLAMDGGSETKALLLCLDGLLLTGAQSNIAAWRYGAEQLPSAANLDPARDEAALRLIPQAIAMGVPVLGICRGLQELNVAFGGSLHQDLDLVDGCGPHKEDETQPRDLQYLPGHGIAVTGSMLRDILRKRQVEVNSLHNQGIRTLAPSLVPEAIAPDGLVEAASIPDASAFALGVQWHPEWYFDRDHVSAAVFRAFGTACRQRRLERAAGTRRGASIDRLQMQSVE